MQDALSPLDYRLWPVYLQELRRRPPATLEEPISAVNEYSSLEKPPHVQVASLGIAQKHHVQVASLYR